MGITETKPNSGMRCGTSGTQGSSKAKLIPEGAKRDFHWVKDYEGIPPFEAMLSRNREGLYIQGLRYLWTERG